MKKWQRSSKTKTCAGHLHSMIQESASGLQCRERTKHRHSQQQQEPVFSQPCSYQKNWNETEKDQGSELSATTDSNSDTLPEFTNNRAGVATWPNLWAQRQPQVKTWFWERKLSTVQQCTYLAQNVWMRAIWIPLALTFLMISAEVARRFYRQKQDQINQAPGTRSSQQHQSLFHWSEDSGPKFTGSYIIFHQWGERAIFSIEKLWFDDFKLSPQLMHDDWEKRSNLYPLCRWRQTKQPIKDQCLYFCSLRANNSTGRPGQSRKVTSQQRISLTKELFLLLEPLDEKSHSICVDW